MKKRILIFTTTYLPFIGGAEIALKEITERLPEYEFDIITTNLDGKQVKEEHQEHVHIYRVGSGRKSKILFPLISIWKASILHRRYRYDLIWSMMASYAGFAGLFFSYLHPKLPFILSLQEGDTHQELRKKFQFVYPLFKKIFTRATHVQAISEYLAQFARDLGVIEENITVVPNGVDVSVFGKDVSTEVDVLRKKYNVKESDVILVTTSRLVKKNAVEDIISSLVYLPKNYRLFIVGDGPLREHLEKGVVDIGVRDRVKFVGEMSHSMILPYIKMADVFVRPSLSEGFGNSFVEAMAARTPVIATQVGGIVDFVYDPQAHPDKKPTGLFCEVHNPKSIAAQVQKMMESDELRNEIIQNAYTLVQDRHDWSIIAHQMQKQVFEVLLKDES